MAEKIFNNEIFTPEELKKIIKDAEAVEKSEAKRSGDYVEYAGPQPEDFTSLSPNADRINFRQKNKIKSKPRPEFAQKTGNESHGWLNSWQDKNEIDRGERKRIKN